MFKPKVYGTKVVAEQTVRVSPPIEQESPEITEARWEQLNEKLKAFADTS